MSKVSSYIMIENSSFKIFVKYSLLLVFKLSIFDLFSFGWFVDELRFFWQIQALAESFSLTVDMWII